MYNKQQQFEVLTHYIQSTLKYAETIDHWKLYIIDTPQQQIQMQLLIESIDFEYNRVEDIQATPNVIYKDWRPILKFDPYDTVITKFYKINRQEVNLIMVNKILKGVEIYY